MLEDVLDAILALENLAIASVYLDQDHNIESLVPFDDLVILWEACRLFTDICDVIEAYRDEEIGLEVAILRIARVVEGADGRVRRAREDAAAQQEIRD